MQPTSYPARLPRGHRAVWPTQRTPRRERSDGRPGSARGRFSAWLRGLPRWVHAIPYAALVLLGAVLLMPGVVPHGPVCGAGTGAASLTARQLFFHLSAVAFGLVAALVLLSARAASAQRRGGRPGLPTIVSSSLLGAVTLAAMIWPHAPAAAPAQAAMVIDMLGLITTRGAAFAVPAVACAVAWSTMRGPRSLRRAQILAWATLLLALPLIMALTYLTVTPICFD
jgi:bacteriorhodopsin